MGKPLGPTGEFFRRRDEWRKHPMLNKQLRHPPTTSYTLLPILTPTPLLNLTEANARWKVEQNLDLEVDSLCV
ncbi:unnamed protein product, partial [Vitis vinifera]